MTGHPYAYKLTIEVPDEPYPERLAKSMAEMGHPVTGTLTRHFDGVVVVPEGVTAEQVREYVVNDAAREHLGKTVTITHWELVPAPQELAR
ncbi:hypothetical protein [Micromonospora carbonacea]|uniref:hypothetical protein n=1 Tax=Micromonospora carbonacea TaxID=47853 RepID=UPI0033DE7ED0